MSLLKENMKISDLNDLYTDGEQCDQELFAEQRSNILLVAGEHYFRKGSKYWNRVRSDKDLSQDQKLRLTKNHTGKITGNWINNLVSITPGTIVSPKNDSELSNQKSAELNNSVWNHIKGRIGYKSKVYTWAKDFMEIGEVLTKIYFDPNGGEFLGWEPAVDPETGEPLLDEEGQPKKGVPKFRGEFCAEKLYAFNVLRHKSAKTFEESPVVIIRKMSSTKELKSRYAGDKEKLSFIQESSDKTYMVFDGSRGAYVESKGETMVREYYFRSCYEYPMGYFYITTDRGILEEGELPFGIFPIVYEGCDEIQTSPRCRSRIKQIRPYQAEINRTASKIAEHQVTLGDDKIFTQYGTKLSQGSLFPGVRNYSYEGMAPTILQGRTGEQYVAYMESQISEMYSIAEMDEENQELPENADPYMALFSSMRNKKKFAIYAQKFERFLVKITETFLALAKQYYEEDRLVQIVGRSEFVNIAEFKTTTDLQYVIQVDEQIEDLESKIGKQIALNHIIQYAGAQLPPDSLGKIIRIMPYANQEEAFNDLTMDYDNATADILALDRGELPPFYKRDNHDYMIKRLSNRMRKRDFLSLNPQVQGNYDDRLHEHEAEIAAQEKAIQEAEAGFIPTGGYLVVCDLYVPSDPSNPEKTKRARVPYESLQWLLEKLEKQNMGQKQISGMEQAQLAEISQIVSQQMGAQGDSGASQNQEAAPMEGHAVS